MIGILLALALTQQTTCTVVSIAPVSVVCAHGTPRRVELTDIQWPSDGVWGQGPFLTGVYNAEIVDGKVFPLYTPSEPERDARIREQTLKEMRRWRTQTLGLPRKPE